MECSYFTWFDLQELMKPLPITGSPVLYRHSGFVPNDDLKQITTATGAKTHKKKGSRGQNNSSILAFYNLVPSTVVSRPPNNNVKSLKFVWL